MTDNNHPITPTPELIEEWIELSRPRKDHSPNPNVLATYAARWGANRELQFCLDWFQEFYKGETWMHKDLKIFMAARRPALPCPKPPSLKEQALKALDQADKGLNESEWQQRSDIIRRAIESLSS